MLLRKAERNSFGDAETFKLPMLAASLQLGCPMLLVATPVTAVTIPEMNAVFMQEVDRFRSH